MFNFVLTQNSTPIIGFCAKLLGKVMEWLYLLFDKGFNIENIGLCIIVFTLIVKLLMIPLTVKQQKFSKLSSLMNPEIQAIQKKYQGKRDTDSMMKMNEETQAVYEKYGTSPTGSCLQLLIQMPLLFSLYYIVSSIPAYVPQVYDYFQPVSEAVVSDYDYFKYMDKAYDSFILEEGAEDEYAFVDEMIDSFHDSKNERKVVDVLAKYSTKQWDSLEDSYENADKMILSLKEVKDSEWDELIKDNEDDKEIIENIKNAVKSGDISEYIDSSFSEVIRDDESKIMDIYKFGPINLSQSPNTMMGIYLLIPFLSFLSQFISVKISMNSNKEQMAENPMGNSMKVMNIMMPLMSAFIAFTVPSGLGVYWICTAIFQMITQICLNAYFKKVDVNDIIAKNVEKANKKKERMGIDPNRVSTAASKNTKSISSKANISTKNIDNSNVKYKAGSMAEKANMVKKYNDNNRK